MEFFPFYFHNKNLTIFNNYDRIINTYCIVCRIKLTNVETSIKMIIEVRHMYRDRIVLSIQDILEKEFKIDARGYRLQEVDKFLDTIIGDYNEYNNIIKELDREKAKLIEENQALKQEIRDLKSNIEAVKYSEKEITNVDLLRRISQLEKIILGKENN